MDYQKLIFAAHVNDLAKALRAGDRNRAFKESEGMLPGEREEVMEAWEHEHHPDNYIQPAFTRLLDVSKVVESLWNEVSETERQQKTEAMVRAFTS